MRNIYEDPAQKKQIAKLKKELMRLKKELQDNDEFALQLPANGVDPGPAQRAPAAAQ
jgi:hypothetical protein